MKRFIKIIGGILGAACMAVILLTVVSCKKSSYSSGSGSDSTVAYSGTMIKSASDVVTSATGSVTATYNPGSGMFKYTVNWNNLSGAAVQMHFHDGTPPSAPIVIAIQNFPADSSGSVSGEATLTAEQANDLGAGKLFAQIHTAAWPNGEIYAVLSKKSQSTGDGY